MIDIQKLEASDCGREVKYQAMGVTEWGRISRWNDRYIWVLYHHKQYDDEPGIKRVRRSITPEATSPSNLEFCE